MELLIDKETTELQRVLMVSEFLLVSIGLDSPLLMMSLRRMANVLFFSRGIDGFRRRPASRILSCLLCHIWYSLESLNSEGFRWRMSSKGRMIVSALLPTCNATSLKYLDFQTKLHVDFHEQCSNISTFYASKSSNMPTDSIVSFFCCKLKF